MEGYMNFISDYKGKAGNRPLIDTRLIPLEDVVAGFTEQQGKLELDEYLLENFGRCNIHDYVDLIRELDNLEMRKNFFKRR